MVLGSCVIGWLRKNERIKVFITFGRQSEWRHKGVFPCKVSGQCYMSLLRINCTNVAVPRAQCHPTTTQCRCTFTCLLCCTTTFVCKLQSDEVSSCTTSDALQVIGEVQTQWVLLYRTAAVWSTELCYTAALLNNPSSEEWMCAGWQQRDLGLTAVAILMKKCSRNTDDNKGRTPFPAFV
jgi:hypothetical protein